MKVFLPFRNTSVLCKTFAVSERWGWSNLKQVEFAQFMLSFFYHVSHYWVIANLNPPVQSRFAHTILHEHKQKRSVNVTLSLSQCKLFDIQNAKESVTIMFNPPTPKCPTQRNRIDPTEISVTISEKRESYKCVRACVVLVL